MMPSFKFSTSTGLIFFFLIKKKLTKNKEKAVRLSGMQLESSRKIQGSVSDISFKL